ncbi:HrgA protein [Histophilus somni]|uniref:HrgA protein n=1 Tax=Histophilus somni TaxID=731 RepID=A0A9Q6Z096_HISSO|nr:HrgA protein [Histophilus somni]ARU65426.1 HrgA protein [Histophilus somni]ARU67294.1 HrgA protein [Histophilus somni]ARU69172.1 HrgA protein [Histophilus somni]ARU71051.1 HrgA protein [Histophilus somni]ARU72922.1 HrgA protein [Histophilus somni]
MKTLSQAAKVVTFLRQNPQQKFTARKIAEAITAQYSADYQHKKAKFANPKAFMQQIVAEIGSQKDAILKNCPEIQIQDKPRPRLFWYENSSDTEISGGLKHQTFSEHDLYPQLMQFLSQELNLYCLRIDEKRSKNNRGHKGNQWLHPDIVAMQALDKQWTQDIQDCAKLGSGKNVVLWSFEVKCELNGGNVRESFFQAVSNSSWANEGYLVTTAIVGEHTEEELRILSALHGIGVIILNLDDLNESEILLPAKRKTEIDWQSANRIVEQNTDFNKFIEYVAIYYKTGKIVKESWNK